jgi:hypothetical protein
MKLTHLLTKGGSVTYKQFYSELKKLKGQYKVDNAGMIRACDQRKTGYCPIVGLSLKKGGPNNYPDGARFLRLSENQMNTIVDAADNDLATTTRKSVRTNLLKTLGLKEASRGTSHR